MRWLGLAVLVGTMAHYAYLVYHGRPWDLLWMCHTAALLVGAGCLLDWPVCIGIGLLWLTIGVPLWLLNLATGGEFAPTSLLTHFGGLGVGLAYVAVRGMPAGAWWQSCLGMLVLQTLCRWLTPADANVNMAFKVYQGWESWFPSYRWYWVLMTAVLVVVFVGAEWGLRCVFGTGPRSPSASG